MTKPLHTPTVKLKLPLQADMNIHHSPGLMSNGLNWICYICDSDDKIIARINGFDKEETRAKQKLVVDAVNSHEVMKEALCKIDRAVADFLDADRAWDDNLITETDYCQTINVLRDEMYSSRAALALANAKTNKE